MNKQKELASTLSLTVALPAYNEAENLDLLLPPLKSNLTKLGVSFEVLIITEQFPKDNSAEICYRNEVECLVRRGGDLYSDAINTAIGKSKGDWVFIMDADGSHAPELIPEMWDQKDEADLVIASRYVSGGATENPRILILLSRVVNIVFRTVLNLQCADVSNSFRLYKGDDLRKLTLSCKHFDIVEEILVKLVCSSRGYKIKEVPCTFKKRMKGRTKRQLVNFALGYCSTLWRLYRIAWIARREGISW
jgi:dolichol-phosphate mannosyltransferase